MFSRQTFRFAIVFGLGGLAYNFGIWVFLPTLIVAAVIDTAMENRD